MMTTAHYGGGLVASLLVFVYTLYMMYYLTNAEKCDKYMKKQDQDFRKASLIITWISLVLSGISLLASFIMFVKGTWQGYGPGGGYNQGYYSNMMV